MSSAHYDFPVAVSQLKMPDSRDQQVARSAKWLLEQPGGSIVIVTPQKQVHGGVLSGSSVGRGLPTSRGEVCQVRHLLATG